MPAKRLHLDWRMPDWLLAEMQVTAEQAGVSVSALERLFRTDLYRVMEDRYKGQVLARYAAGLQKLVEQVKAEPQPEIPSFSGLPLQTLEPEPVVEPKPTKGRKLPAEMPREAPEFQGGKA